MTTAQLVETFVEIGVAEDAAERRGQIAKYNRLFDQMTEIVNELKGRDGDQRSELVALYGHANLQVWLEAAKCTLAVAPNEARNQLRILAASDSLPYAADAGMCLWNLDRGVFKPE